MPTHDIIVIGASAGGVTALKELAESLPEGFEGSLFVVLHMPAYSETKLAEILNKAGKLKAVNPRDGETIKPGRIYVAQNDFHLLIENDKVLVKKGPKENRFRPSIDALFRSAAASYGSRVVGIVLSGIMNDGTSGLWSIKRQGGLAVIQSPGDAEHPQMPENVLEYVKVDHIVAASQMGALLTQLIEKKTKHKTRISAKEMKMLKMEVVIATRDNAFEIGIMKMGELVPFTCPECHGALVRLVEGKLVRFRCHTGHAYTASSLLASVTETVEEVLWQGMRGLEEVTMLLNNIADHFKELKDNKATTLFRKKAAIAADKARIIHDSVFKLEQYSEDIRYEKKKK